MSLDSIRVETDAEHYDPGAPVEVTWTALNRGSEPISGSKDLLVDGEAVASLGYDVLSGGTDTVQATINAPLEEKRHTLSVGDASTTIKVGGTAVTASRSINGNSVRLKLQVPEEADRLGVAEEFARPFPSDPSIVTEPEETLISAARPDALIVLMTGVSGEVEIEYDVELDDQDHPIEFYVGRERVDVSGDRTIEREEATQFEDLGREELLALVERLFG